MKHKTLLEKAKAAHGNKVVRGRITDEQKELIVAWLRGDVSLTAVAAAINPDKSRTTGSMYCYILAARVVRQMVADGEIILPKP